MEIKALIVVSPGAHATVLNCREYIADTLARNCYWYGTTIVSVGIARRDHGELPQSDIIISLGRPGSFFQADATILVHQLKQRTVSLRPFSIIIGFGEGYVGIPKQGSWGL